jgi:tetratricopeptide (TPR) repeat protein
VVFFVNKLRIAMKSPEIVDNTASIALLAQSAAARIDKEEFEFGFELLSLAQDKSASEPSTLGPDDAIFLGRALATAGHALFNFYIDDTGHDSGAWCGPASDPQGRLKFRQAAEVFNKAIENYPHDVRGYLGLSDMQWELGQDYGSTLRILEALLDEKPNLDTTTVRLDLAQQYQRLEDSEAVTSSFAKAIELSVDERHLRFTVVNGLAKHLTKNTITDQDQLQKLFSAPLRAMILAQKTETILL